MPLLVFSTTAVEVLVGENTNKGEILRRKQDSMNAAMEMV